MADFKAFYGDFMAVHLSPMAELADVVAECGEFSKVATCAMEDPHEGGMQRIKAQAEQLIRETMHAVETIDRHSILSAGQLALDV